MQLLAGLAGGNVSAPPPEWLLHVGDRMRLGLQQPRPEGRITASLELPSDTTCTRNTIDFTSSLTPFILRTVAVMLLNLSALLSHVPSAGAYLAQPVVAP